MTLFKNRFTYMVIVGVVVELLINLTIPITNENHNPLYDVLISIFITIIVWEGNLRINKWLDGKYSWIHKPLKRIVAQALLGIVYSTIIIYLSVMAYSNYICELPLYKKDTIIITSIIIGVLVSIIILSVKIGSQFLQQWRASLLEVEKYKNESLEAQLQNLKSQINPHFLFNNLSVLSSLVYQDQDKAVEFINQLSKVYRYLLDNKEQELVSLQTELNFIHSYTHLLKIRFDKNIYFDFQIADDVLNKQVPPMALQTLIENAIKHNEISSEQPLTVSIISNNDYLLISNNLQHRKIIERSSKIGLQNIQQRYKYFTEKPVQICQKENKFEVKIPLLNLQ